MNAIVIEHVPVAELPEAWQQKLGQAAGARVTVRIEPESPVQLEGDVAQFADDQLFGMWRDRKDTANVEDYVRRTRALRFKGKETSGKF